MRFDVTSGREFQRGAGLNGKVDASMPSPVLMHKQGPEFEPICMSCCTDEAASVVSHAFTFRIVFSIVDNQIGDGVPRITALARLMTPTLQVIVAVGLSLMCMTTAAERFFCAWIEVEPQEDSIIWNSSLPSQPFGLP